MAIAERFSFLCAQCKGDILPGQAYTTRGRNRIHLQPDCGGAVATLAQEADLWDRNQKANIISFGRTRVLFQRIESEMLSMSKEYIKGLSKRRRRETWVRPRRVCIRSFRAIARMRSYSCYRCDTERGGRRVFDSTIWCGDEYEAEVFVGDNGWETRRYHISCPWDDGDPYGLEDDIHWPEDLDDVEEPPSELEKAA